MKTKYVIKIQVYGLEADWGGSNPLEVEFHHDANIYYQYVWNVEKKRAYCLAVFDGDEEINPKTTIGALLLEDANREHSLWYAHKEFFAEYPELKPVPTEGENNDN